MALEAIEWHFRCIRMDAQNESANKVLRRLRETAGQLDDVLIQTRSAIAELEARLEWSHSRGRVISTALDASEPTRADSSPTSR